MYAEGAGFFVRDLGSTNGTLVNGERLATPRALRPGDRIEISRSDGRVARFAVTTVAAYPKTAFPSAAVYGAVPGPELRLVTCGGQFDRSERSYRDNIVVDAVLI